MSPSGMAFVDDGKNQSLLLACLSDRVIKKLIMDNGKVVDQQALFDEPKMRFRHVAQSPDKRIYFSTDDGKIYRL